MKTQFAVCDRVKNCIHVMMNIVAPVSDCGLSIDRKTLALRTIQSPNARRRSPTTTLFLLIFLSHVYT